MHSEKRLEFVLNIVCEGCRFCFGQESAGLLDYKDYRQYLTAGGHMTSHCTE